MLQFNFQIHPWLPILNGVHQEEKKIDRGTKGGKNKEKKKAEENNTKDDHEEEGRENEEETKVKENMGEKTKEEADKQKANQKVDQEVEGTMKTDEIELDDLSPASPDQEEKGDSDPEIRELESKSISTISTIYLCNMIFNFEFFFYSSSWCQLLQRWAENFQRGPHEK